IKKVDVAKGEIDVHAGGKDRTVKVAGDLKVLGTDDKPLPDGLKANELKEGAEVTLTIQGGQEGGPVIKVIRLGKRDNPRSPQGGPQLEAKPSVGLKPLNEMTAADKYKGEDGGLYGGGKNEPSEALQAAAQ